MGYSDYAHANSAMRRYIAPNILKMAAPTNPYPQHPTVGTNTHILLNVMLTLLFSQRVMHVIYFTCTLDKEEVGKCVLPKLMYASYTKSSYGNKVNTVV